jgi:hypothetical protein
MIRLDPKERASFDRLQRLIDRIKVEWLRDPNIVDLQPVLKMRRRAVQPETLVIGFYVNEKVRRDLLDERGVRAIPEEIEGVATDVIQVRQRAHGSVDEKATRSAMFDTLVGGCAVGNSQMGYYGTLAMPLLAISDGRMVGLTNEHVLVFDGEGHAGDDVWQPRFHLNGEVSLDSADCCPNGQLHYRGVDNPIVDASAAVFAAAALAAALSDVIDPHRRGQAATVPNPQERTVKETVSATIAYPEIPFPGRPYKVGTKWNYARQTDTRVLQHGVAETQVNQHVLTGLSLTTDQSKYPRGSRVIFIAVLGPENDKVSCGRYFVTAAALSPSHNKAYKLVLRPVAVGATHTEAAAAIKRRCVYRGVLELAHDEELGEWTTYCFAQTRNDAPLGIEPTVAAQTIGGLPVTNNYVDGGETDNFIYGHRCNVDLRPDGQFEVIAPDSGLH